MTSPKSPFALAVTTLAILSATNSNAAPITWSAPFNITSEADIDTSGTLHTAVNTVSNGNPQPVTIGAETITFTPDGDVGPNTTGTGTFFTGDGGTSGNADLDTVLNSHTYNGSTWSFDLDGLTAGNEYQVQLVGAADTRDCCDGRNQRAGDADNPESISDDFSRSGPGSVIGTFTADTTTQTINILPGINTGTDPGISLYIVRDLTADSPLPPTDITLSNTDLAPSTPAGTTVATLTVEDPNPSDSHTFSFRNTEALPDNARFTFVGNQLRAATELGSFGTTYTIFIRATDPGGLTFDKAFTLTVEPAQAPVSVSVDSNTIAVGAPAGATVATLSTNDPNSADAHAYSLVAGAGSTDNAAFTIDGSSLNLVDPAPAAGTTLSVRVRSTDLSGLSVDAPLQFVVTSVALRINEFLADGSSSTIPDEDGEPVDWIELYNPEDSAASLAGLYLTDDPNNLTKWQFPAASSVPARGYLIVYASSKDRTTTELHTNFSLNAGGEFLALVAADGTTPLTSFGSAAAEFPSQRNAISFGFFGTPAQIGYMLNPTPGAANDDASGTLGFVADTKFDHDRGFYDAPFDLAITSATPDVTIRYTTDGSWPSETLGQVYNGPITISRTTTLKALATRPGYLPTDIDTHTFIFVDDVVAQTDASTRADYGFPTSWRGNATYYGMNRNSSVNPATHPTIKQDLKTVPSLVIGIDVDDMFEARNGIYANPTSSGTTWERLTSLEIIDPNSPDGALDHQQNCAIRIQGGAFRNFGLTRKKSFRVIFKSDFGPRRQPTGGPGKLDYPLFSHIDPDAAEQFDTLIFRMESNDGWQWGGANGQPQYARDEFGRRSQLALGQPAAHGRYMHLYINGVYWGVYNIVERPDAGFAETYLGADKETWQGQNSGNPTNSATNINQWTLMTRVVDDISNANNDADRDAEYLEAYGFNPDGSRNPELPIWIDATNFIDYLLVNWYAGNSDWPFKNYYGGMEPSPDSTGYKFFMWDSEWSLLLRSNLNTDKTTDFRGIAAPQQHLAGDPNSARFPGSPEYRLRWADRTHRAFFNNGPMSPENTEARYREITSQHTSILVPEAARWGDQHGQARDVGDWQREFSTITRSWFPGRGNRFITQLKARGLYPDTDAPTYSQHGGSISTTQGITLSVPSDVERVYYMVGDGDADPTGYAHSLDPRLVGGNPNPSATVINFTGGGNHVTPPIFFNSPKWLFSRSFDTTTNEWSALNTAFFSIDSVPADNSNLVVSEFNYHPHEPTTPAEIAISTDRDDYEFIELRNTSPDRSLDLTGVRFTDGITFTFPEKTFLPAGTHLVLARDTDAYTARYPDAPTPFAEYTGRLSNDGEQVILASTSGTIHDFTYNDKLPWPEAADGTGASLTLIAPSPTPDHNAPTSWRAAPPSPGTDISPDEDNDHDGLTLLLELALGTSDGEPNFAPFTTDTSTGTLVVTFPFNIAVEGQIDLHPESSTDLLTWTPNFTQTATTDNGDGTSTLTFTSTAPLATTPTLYIRLSATAIPGP